MKKNEITVKTKKKFWRTACMIVFMSALLVITGLMYRELRQLVNQITYMQDTTNIILSDVNGMQADIEKTLREEASMVESYSIEIVDMDFLRRTYKVDVSAVPKEYTEKTKMSIFFGTTECALRLEGYAYKGSLSLPLDKTFDGNIPFLLANGKKKTTEVIEEYDGLQTHLSEVLSGTVEDIPSYKDGTMKLDTACSFQLDGFDRYEFEEFKLVAQMDGEEIGVQNLLVDLPEQTEGITTTETAETVGNVQLTGAHSGDAEVEFSYDMDEQEQTANHQIRVYFKAVSTEGYRFEYDVFRGMYLGSEEMLDEESFDRSVHSAVYDTKGGKLEF